jgi:hypothetical protein
LIDAPIPDLVEPHESWLHSYFGVQNVPGEEDDGDEEDEAMIDCNNAARRGRRGGQPLDYHANEEWLGIRGSLRSNDPPVKRGERLAARCEAHASIDCNHGPTLQSSIEFAVILMEACSAAG